MKKFPYKLEFCPNPDCISIQARSRFPQASSMDSLDLRFGNKESKGRKRHPLYLALSKINGLKSASGGGYNLQVVKANALFTWDELLPKVLGAIQATVAGKRVMIQIGEPKRPSEEYLLRLRLQGCDI